MMIRGIGGVLKSGFKVKGRRKADQDRERKKDCHGEKRIFVQNL
jgi:hypothetical protein